MKIFKFDKNTRRRKALDELEKEGKNKLNYKNTTELSNYDFISINIVYLYNALLEITESVGSECSKSKCKKMSLGNYNYEYSTGKASETPKSIDANQYIEKAFNRIYSFLVDTIIFPIRDDDVYIEEIDIVLSELIERLFEISGHYVTMHENKLKELTTTILKYLIEFSRYWNLCDDEVFIPYN